MSRRADTGLFSRPSQFGSSEIREGDLSLSSLMSFSPLTKTKDVRIAGPALDANDTIIRGRMLDTCGPTGMFVHATDTVEAHDLTKEWVMQPALMVAIILEGSLTVNIGEQILQLGNGDQPQGYFWNLTKPTKIIRQSQTGTHIRKVVVRVPNSWIDLLAQEQTNFGKQAPWPIRTHCAMGEWAPSSHALALAEQLVNQKQGGEALQVLTTESKGAEIAQEALGCILQGNEPIPQPPETRQAVKARQIREFICAHLDQDISLAELSNMLGMSIGTMQGAFKRTYQKTIGDFTREQRLDRARTQIESQGLSVSEAGYKAGYDSPAGFSTAFKRHFGFPPSDCKC